jgi:hypothetical protein
MGLSIGSSCSYDEKRKYTVPVADSEPQKLPNPDPKKFIVNRTFVCSGNTACMVVAVNYPDCTNYEGDKILLFVGDVPNFNKVTKLDPHFCEGDHLSPFARFEPTNQGWIQAVALAERMKD